MVNLRTLSRLIDPQVSRSRRILSGHTCNTLSQNDQIDSFVFRKFGNAHALLIPEKEAHMKPMRHTAICTLFVMALLGSAFAQKVQTDFDHQANFSQYKTYSWQEIKPANSLWDARIKNAVDAQLAAKGWTQVPSGGDVAVVAIKTTQTQRTLQTFYDGMGGGWGWRRFGGGGFGDATTTEQDYKEGTLVIDFYDAKTKQLIWRGSAQDTLSDKAAQNEKNLDKGVAKMFKAFPPSSAKG
jgi:hypothetical protein